MKKFIMTFLVAGLMITSAFSLSSCKKTNTNASAEEWIPTTFDFVGKDNSLLRDGVPGNCPYCTLAVNPCNHGVLWWSYDEHGQQIVCPLGAYDPVTNPSGHYHDHCFSATDNCAPADQPNYVCLHQGRKHRHVVVLWQQGWDNHWHLGGCGNGQ